MKDEHDSGSIDWLEEILSPDEIAKTTLVIIKIGRRFFNKFGKNNRVYTAWSLAGAQTFIPNHHKLANVYSILMKKNVKGIEILKLEITQTTKVINNDLEFNQLNNRNDCSTNNHHSIQKTLE